MLMFEKYQSIMILCEEPIKVAHCKEIKLNFGMHPQLNTNLQEGIIIKPT
jgi:hypothetical protein